MEEIEKKKILQTLFSLRHPNFKENTIIVTDNLCVKK